MVIAGDVSRNAALPIDPSQLVTRPHPTPNRLHVEDLLERSDGTVALVTEPVEGATLADRIARGALAIG
jgi:hypothetical protein